MITRTRVSEYGCGPTLASAGLLAYIGLRGLLWAYVGLHWPMLAYIGLHGLLWAYIGLCCLCGLL